MVNCWKNHPFYLWCERYLPIYWNDSLSLDENINRLICIINELIKLDKELLQAWVDFQNQFDKLQSTIENNLKDWIIQNSTSIFKDSINTWLCQYMPEIIASIVKFVFFGLSDDGHFIAYIPKSWEFLSFSTPVNCSDKNYGHLILTY